MRIVQYVTEAGDRRVGAIFGNAEPREVNGASSTYELVLEAQRQRCSLQETVEQRRLGGAIDYDRALAERRILLPIDHPDPAHMVLALTGLTHLGSAASRAQMHSALGAAELTDSMRMFKLGIDGGKPAPGAVGVQPEWAYKGDGSWAVPPGGDLDLPSFGEDGGEEAEIAGLYVIGDDDSVLRVGYALANEFSDHVMEARNYLYLAHSKLRPSSFGPELLVGELPSHVEGQVTIARAGRTLWSGTFISGEENMCHSIANLEHHHFKYSSFRRPGDVHVYYFGASVLSMKYGIATEPGDVVEITCDLFGKPLVNTLMRREEPAPRIRPL